MPTHCRKGDTGLFLHGYDERCKASWADPITGLSSEVWSEGLGWYALILVEALERWPEGHAGRAPVRAILEELLGGLLRAQDPASGLWFQVVDKGHLPDNWCDTSGSAMFVYTLQRASELGIGDTRQPAPRRRAVAMPGCRPGHPRRRTAAWTSTRPATACACRTATASTSTFRSVVNAKEAVGGVLWAATIMEHAGEAPVG